MNRTTVVHISKPHDEYIGRPSLFGNPFPITGIDFRSTVIRKFEEYFFERFCLDEKFRIAALDLKGKKLACYCRPLKCHGDVIANFLNDLP